mmetsp:Transcript_107442/g.186554  ORF Transcript_107442/g.186554 Transcript_107442/m.186554 type:complete len:218 (-) Transcript_107442:300-953(-)
MLFHTFAKSKKDDDNKLVVGCSTIIVNHGHCSSLPVVVLSVSLNVRKQGVEILVQDAQRTIRNRAKQFCFLRVLSIFVGLTYCHEVAQGFPGFLQQEMVIMAMCLDELMHCVFLHRFQRCRCLLLFLFCFFFELAYSDVMHPSGKDRFLDCLGIAVNRLQQVRMSSIVRRFAAPGSLLATHGLTATALLAAFDFFPQEALTSDPTKSQQSTRQQHQF